MCKCFFLCGYSSHQCSISGVLLPLLFFSSEEYPCWHVVNSTTCKNSFLTALVFINNCYRLPWRHNIYIHFTAQFCDLDFTKSNFTLHSTASIHLHMRFTWHAVSSLCEGDGYIWVNLTFKWSVFCSPGASQSCVPWLQKWPVSESCLHWWVVETCTSVVFYKMNCEIKAVLMQQAAIVRLSTHHHHQTFLSASSKPLFSYGQWWRTLLTFWNSTA